METGEQLTKKRQDKAEMGCKGRGEGPVERLTELDEGGPELFQDNPQVSSQLCLLVKQCALGKSLN
jgi:hypothetical protein